MQESTAMTNQEPDWMGLWAEPLRERARVISLAPKKTMPDHVADMVNHVLRERKTGLKCDATQVIDWLNGRDVPEQEAMRDALYMALGLRYSAQTNGHRVILREAVNGIREALAPEKTTAEIEALVAMRTQADMHYENALLEALTRDENAPVPTTKVSGCSLIRGPRETAKEVTHYQKLFSIRTRLTAEDFSYWGDAERKKFLHTTDDPAQFIACWRSTLTGSRASHISSHELAELVGISDTSISDYETGRHIPRGRALYSLERYMKPDIYTLYEALIIRTRAQLIDLHENEEAVVAKELREMPRQYHREAIRQLLGGTAEDAAAPCWANVVRPIQTQGEYLTALRYAFGKPLVGEIEDNKNKILGLPSAARMKNAESKRPSETSSRRELSEFYRVLQAERLSGIDRFAEYNNKPPLDWRFFDASLLDPESPRCLPTLRPIPMLSFVEKATQPAHTTTMRINPRQT